MAAGCVWLAGKAHSRAAVQAGCVWLCVWQQARQLDTAGHQAGTAADLLRLQQFVLL